MAWSIHAWDDVRNLVIRLHNRIDRCVQLVRSLQEHELNDEEILQRLATLFGDELSGGLCGSS
jgi:hypothetical protein